MKILYMFLFLLTAPAIYGERNGLSIDSALYLEPINKPGVTISLDYNFKSYDKSQLSTSLMEITYLWFPDNFNAIYIYPEINYTYTFSNNLILGINWGTGISISQKIVPVYNSDGIEIPDNYTVKLFLKSSLLIGYNIEKNNIYVQLGWKGLYPNNLSIQNQPFIQLGYKRYLND